MAFALEGFSAVIVLLLVIAVMVWIVRLKLRKLRDLAGHAMDMAQEMKGHGTRMGRMLQQDNEDMARGIMDIRLAQVAMAGALVSVEEKISRSEERQLCQLADQQFNMGRDLARDMVMLMRVILDDADSPEDAIARLGQRMHVLGSEASFADVESMASALRPLNEAQTQLLMQAREAG